VRMRLSLSFSESGVGETQKAHGYGPRAISLFSIYLTWLQYAANYHRALQLYLDDIRVLTICQACLKSASAEESEAVSGHRLEKRTRTIALFSVELVKRT